MFNPTTHLHARFIGDEDGDVKRLIVGELQPSHVLRDALMGRGEAVHVTVVRGEADTPVIPTYPRLRIVEVQPTRHQSAPGNTM